MQARVGSIQEARRSLRMSSAEASVLIQDEAQQHIADGTLVMGRESYYAPTVRKFTGDDCIKATLGCHDALTVAMLVEECPSKSLIATALRPFVQTRRSLRYILARNPTQDLERKGRV